MHASWPGPFSTAPSVDNGGSAGTSYATCHLTAQRFQQGLHALLGACNPALRLERARSVVRGASQRYCVAPLDPFQHLHARLMARQSRIHEDCQKQLFSQETAGMGHDRSAGRP